MSQSEVTLNVSLKIYDILNTNGSDETRKEYEDCKNRLESFYDNITKGHILRSKVEWYEKGEKSNKYFYNLEKATNQKHTYVVLLSITLKRMIKTL